MNNNLKILIADDSELMRIVMKGFFNKLLPSPIITQASNLNETFDLIRRESFDLLILDINMPNGDSNPKTVIEIHAIQPNLKVCMFSGNDKSLLEQSYYDAGAIGFIQKNEKMGSSAEELLKLLYPN
ncbi:response regulator transcription factor [Pedobacter fastidiosus]|uniref:Response regulator transcription factor n=1 Tax=Pedobacter fastidiosus TaxID=2765361 RepID=A0ABR7KMU9_9SPHI|nr:response regulator transcription factor [Pedobacter fastidiosus]MBC6109390.1 response regulator transcription factor [Pedobacter fastidiosus]